MATSALDILVGEFSDRDLEVTVVVLPPTEAGGHHYGLQGLPGSLCLTKSLRWIPVWRGQSGAETPDLSDAVGFIATHINTEFEMLRQVKGVLVLHKR